MVVTHEPSIVALLVLVATQGAFVCLKIMLEPLQARCNL
jgi:hypothetical protein